MMKKRVIKAKLLRELQLQCPYCLQPLNENNIELTKTGLIICQNRVGESSSPCLKRFSLTYCGACKKIDLTTRMTFHTKKMVGSMRQDIRYHVCDNGKLSSVIERPIPHIKQVFIDDKGKVLINPPSKNKDIIPELREHWERNSRFTVDMIGKGKVDKTNLTVLPESFRKSDALPLIGHDEPLSRPYCERCSQELMQLPDGSLATGYSHVCPNCQVYFKVIPHTQHRCDQCNDVLTKLPCDKIDGVPTAYTHVCPQCGVYSIIEKAVHEALVD